MRRNIILVIIGIIIINVAVSLFFFYRMKIKALNFIRNQMEGNFLHTESIEHARDMLKLSDKQVEEMKMIDAEYDKMEEHFRNNLKILMIDLKNNIIKENFDEANTRKIMEKIDKDRREIRILNLKEIFELEKVLDQEQKEKYRKYIKDFHNREGRPGPPPPPEPPCDPCDMY